MGENNNGAEKIRQFLGQLLDYYGEWPNPNVPKVINAYLNREINPDRLPDLFRYVCYSHPVRFGPPSVAELEKAIREQVDPARGRREVKRLSPAGAQVQAPVPIEIPEAERVVIDRQLNSFGGLMGLIRSRRNQQDRRTATD